MRLAACVLTLALASSANAQLPPGTLSDLSLPLMLVCVPNQLLGQPIGDIAKTLPPGMAIQQFPQDRAKFFLKTVEGDAYAWSTTEQSGMEVITLSPETGCTILAKGFDGKAIADRWDSSIASPESPFKKEKEVSEANLKSRFYRGTLGGHTAIAEISYGAVSQEKMAVPADVRAMVTVKRVD